MKIGVECKVVGCSQRNLWLQQKQTQTFCNMVVEQTCRCDSWNEEDRKKYYEAKKDTKRIVSMDRAARQALEKVNSCCCGHELFRIVKQRTGEKAHVIGVTCLKDESDMVKVGVNDRKQIWKEHIERLINVENKWRSTLPLKVVGAAHKIDAEEVQCAMNDIKNGKISGSSGILLEMLKSGGEPSLNSLAAIFNDIFGG